MRAGGHELLTKPFVAKDLLDAISRSVLQDTRP
jgi:FixJ family two-component response regulator